MKVRGWRVCAAFATIMAGACMPEVEEPLSPADVQPTADTDEGAATLASAYCDYAVRCSRVGEGAEFASRDQCLATFLPSINAKLQTEARCDSGVGLDDVKECVTDLGNDSCVDGPFTYGEMRQPLSCDLRNICLQ